jgi:hypothetical protein
LASSFHLGFVVLDLFALKAKFTLRELTGDLLVLFTVCGVVKRVVVSARETFAWSCLKLGALAGQYFIIAFFRSVWGINFHREQIFVTGYALFALDFHLDGEELLVGLVKNLPGDCVFPHHLTDLPVLDEGFETTFSEENLLPHISSCYTFFPSLFLLIMGF